MLSNGEPPLVGLLLRLAAQQWGTDMDGALQARGVGGITPAHANVIPFVPAEGIQIGELARLAKVRKQTMAHSVDLLTASGYVTRRPDPADGRASLVFLTDKGRALGPASLTAGRTVEQEWAAVVGRDDLEHLRRTLIRLLEPS
ncbi:MarR family winged helix-turn-helix transcriptional regulator [Dactylosporangium sp. McL0621]|uniref:MarR family winged helix-turn-helix transcriptional regulator n=1 Tax=Dactylosporangium sp. McL0621 TaxID=3415678 RepID=UPI003CF2A7A0